MKLKAIKFDVLFFCFQKKKRDTSKFAGVSLYKDRSKYLARFIHEKKNYFCGYFSNELEAAKAVNAKCIDLDIPLRNPEVGLPQNKPQVRFISNKVKVKKATTLKILNQKENNQIHKRHSLSAEKV